MAKDIDGGPGWRIRGSDLRPEIFDLDVFRSGLAGDSLAEPIELLWSGDAAAALSALRVERGTVRVRALRADCHRDLGEHEVAVAEYDALVAETAGTAREAVIRQHRGKALLAAGRARDAVADFERAELLRRDGDATLHASTVQALRLARREVIT